MSTFAVFGINPVSIRKKLEDETSALVGNAFGSGRAHELMRERVNHELPALLSKAKPKQISEWFDAPQFCAEFMEIAQRYGCTQLSIRQRKLVKVAAGEYKSVVEPCSWTPPIDPRDDYERNEQQSERLSF